MTIIENATAFLQGKFQNANVTLNGERIVGIGNCLNPVQVINAEGKYLVPGFVDIHIHGAAGSDFCDGTVEAFERISNYLASVGVTSFLGTSMAYDRETLVKLFHNSRLCTEQKWDGCAVMYGVNMEGPFFSKVKKGAQSENYIIDPDIELFHDLYAASSGTIKLVDIAPELPGALEFIKAISGITTVSLAHTTADYDTAANALQNGASHITHLFNAMPPFTHREPGVVGAAFDYAETVELICDGFHIHPSAIRSVFGWFGKDRICFVSDAMRACGLENGEYEFGGQEVYVSNGRATLADSTLAGSCTPLSECVRKAITFGIKPEDAIFCATEVPARRIGIFHQTGSIEAGKTADLILLNKDFTIHRVILRGDFLN